MKRTIVFLLIFAMLTALLSGCKDENVMEVELEGEVYTPSTYVPIEIEPPDISE
ncbi:MAG: hypothetical protein ACI4II_04035 [Acutalibacteraceae bacterium]